MKLTQSEINVICADAVKRLAWHLEHNEAFSNDIVARMTIYITKDGKTITEAFAVSVENYPI